MDCGARSLDGGASCDWLAGFVKSLIRWGKSLDCEVFFQFFELTASDHRGGFESSVFNNI